MMGAFTLEPLGAGNIAVANALTLKAKQQQYIAPLSYGAATAMIDHTQVWSQAIKEGDKVVGFISCSFDETHELPEMHSCILRIHVSAEKQGQGIGRFAIEEAVKEAKKRGKKHLTVVWESGPDGPEEFFLRMGFEVRDQTQYGENIGYLNI